MSGYTIYDETEFVVSGGYYEISDIKTGGGRVPVLKGLLSTTTMDGTFLY